MKIQELLTESGYTAEDIIEVLNDIINDEQPNVEPLTRKDITPELLKQINAEVVDIEMEAEYGENEDHVEGLRLHLWFDTIADLRPEWKNE